MNNLSAILMALVFKFFDPLLLITGVMLGLMTEKRSARYWGCLVLSVIYLISCAALNYDNTAISPYHYMNPVSIIITYLLYLVVVLGTVSVRLVLVKAYKKLRPRLKYICDKYKAVKKKIGLWLLESEE